MDKTIFLKPEETSKEVSKRIIKIRSKKVILHISDDMFLLPLDYFEEIKKYTEKKSKKVFIESTNALILKNAKEAKLNIIEIKKNKRRRPFIDIRSKKLEEKNKGVPQDFFSYIKQKNDYIVSDDTDRIDFKEGSHKPTKKIKKVVNKKSLIYIFLSIILFLIIGVGLYFYLPEATIVIHLKKIPIVINEKIVVSSKTSLPKIKDDEIIIPGELFVSQKNLEVPFVSASTKKTEVKATGKLIVYNRYSSKSQPIVARTRFVSPQGKTFRISKRIVIPGAKVINNEVIPSKIEVFVTADKAGEEYNVPPSKSWKIPGFKGTAKYNGFYAESFSPMTGGFIGDVPVAGEKDIKSAKDLLKSQLRDALNEEMLVLASKKFKFLKGSSNFKMNEETIRQLKNDSHSFGIFGEATMEQLVFNENTLRNVIEKKLKPKDGINLYPKNFVLNYEEPTADFKNGNMSFGLNGSIVFEEFINKNDFIKKISGESEADLKRDVFSIPGLEKANISLKPFWVHNVPKNINKISLIFE